MVSWKNDGWFCIQEADSKRHKLEITCFAESGNVTEVRIRHNDGEESKGRVLKDGASVLPIGVEEFRRLFVDGALEIK